MSEEGVGNLVVLVSHSGRPIDGGLMEAEAVGSNNLNLRNHLKKRKGGSKDEKDRFASDCFDDGCFSCLR